VSHLHVLSFPLLKRNLKLLLSEQDPDEGDFVGALVGAFTGALVGAFTGAFVGALVGAFTGAFVGEEAVPPPQKQHA
jgi:outer membrane lipoprotein SlyB